MKISDVPGHVSKGSPDFCTVYVINKGKISSVKNASRSAPFNSPLLAQIQEQTNNSNNSFQSDARPRHSLSMKGLFIMVGRDDFAFPFLAHLGSDQKGCMIYNLYTYSHTAPWEVAKLILCNFFFLSVIFIIHARLFLLCFKIMLPHIFTGADIITNTPRMQDDHEAIK